LLRPSFSATLGRLQREGRGLGVVIRVGLRFFVFAVVAWSALALAGIASAGPKQSTCRPGATALPTSGCAELRPVPSLQPSATKRLWRKLVRRQRARRRVVAATGDCRPLRAVFYTQTDWMRLATKLAANPSPCAQYYFSFPSFADDHTQVRTD